MDNDLFSYFSETEESSKSQPATERMIYGQFKREYIAFRRANIPKKIVSLVGAQLPNNSILHVMDNLQDPSRETIAPDLSFPLIANEEYLIYLSMHTKIPDAEDPNFPITDRYRFVPGVFLRESQKFYQENNAIVRRMVDLDAVLPRPTVLSVINYNPMLQAHMYGRMVPLRRFHLLLKTVLSNITDIDNKVDGKLHHICVPMSDHTYKKNEVERTFEKFTPNTIRHWNDMSFFFLIHLLGYIADSKTNEFKNLSQGTLDRTSVILTHGTDAIIYNLGDLKALADSARGFYVYVLRHINALKLKGSGVVKDIAALDDDALDALAEKEADKRDVSEAEDAEAAGAPDEDDLSDQPGAISQRAEPFASSELPLDPTPAAIVDPETTTTNRERITKDIDRAIARSDVPLTKTQKDRAVGTIARLDDVKLNNQPLSSLLAEATEPDIHAHDVALFEKVLPDPSMAKSSINKFDRVYVKSQLDRDIATVLTSFSANGMSVYDLKTEDSHTEFNRIRTYTTVFRDLSGKRHTIKFKLPIIDDEGTILINGIRSRMVKQQVNLPICKVSPTRVNLSSNYNKSLIERTSMKARRFDHHLTTHIAKLADAGVISVDYGHMVTESKTPYDYAAIANKYIGLTHKSFKFFFDYPHRINIVDVKTLPSLLQRLKEDEAKDAFISRYEKDLNSVLCGRRGQQYMFYGQDNVIRIVDTTNNVTAKKEPKYQVVESFTMREFFARFNETVALPKMPVEWTEVKLLDRSFPVIFLLGYQYGLTNILKDFKHPHRFVPSGTRSKLGTDEISISFADGKLIFPRYPLTTGLILGGLDRFDMREYVIEQLDAPDTYFTLLASNGLSTNYLKGISDYFKFFVDPITREVLQKMREPTTPRGLLLRATEMLSTMEHYPASSMRNYRMRGYERFPDILYNTLSRALAAQDTARQTGKRAWSINPEAVIMSIIQDPTVQPIEDINPIHDIKQKNMVTYTGQGGRTGRSMVVNDRTFPDDAVGVLSESTPDSSKVAINAYTSSDPLITNVRGMFNTDDDRTLEPANVLSATALLIPGSVQDD